MKISEMESFVQGLQTFVCLLFYLFMHICIVVSNNGIHQVGDKKLKGKFKKLKENKSKNRIHSQTPVSL